MGEALGMVETKGLVAMIEAAAAPCATLVSGTSRSPGADGA